MFFGYEVIPKVFHDRSWSNQLMTQAAFLFHDIAEPVFQDFTPGQIEKKDKQKLEAICIELLTEGRLTGDLQAQHVYNCFLIFEGASQDDFDKMQGHILASIDSSKTPLNLDQSGLSEYLKLVYNLSIDLTEVQEMLKEADVLSMLEPVVKIKLTKNYEVSEDCLLYTSPSPRDQRGSRMPSSA